MTASPRPGRLGGKVAFVTGAARGQGRSHCVRLAAEGADVVAFDLCAPVERRAYIPAATEDNLAETARAVAEAGGRAVTIRGDVRSAGDLARARDAGLAAFGRVDVVCANAGTGSAGKLTHELDEADWAVTLGVNLTGVWLTVKTFLPHLAERGGGSIVLIGSALLFTIASSWIPGPHGGRYALDHRFRLYPASADWSSPIVLRPAQ